MESKLPDKSAILKVFWSAVIPIHTWAVVALLREIPGYVLRFSITDILIITAYIACFALIESMVVTGVLVSLRILLPRKLLVRNFVTKSFILIWLTSLWIIPVHAVSFIYQVWQFEISTFQIMIFLWVMTYISILFIGLKLNNSHEVIRRRISSIIENITLLSSIYLVIDIMSVLVIIFRIISVSLET